MKVAFVGLGQMGSAIAANLLKAGHNVTVYNRTRSRAEALQSRTLHISSRSNGPPDRLAGRFRWKRIDQVRVACQVPLQLSPEMTPRQEPAPLVPPSRPPPVACEAPTVT